MSEQKTVDEGDRVNIIVSRLRDAGYRITPQRMALIEILCRSEEHPSAGQLHEQLKQRFPTTSLATVYKTLNVLKEMGEVLEIGFAGKDARYDGVHPHPHPHLICVQCRRIEDIDVDLDRSQILAEEIAERSGYRVLSHRMDIYGLCPQCQERTELTDGPSSFANSGQPDGS
jgi:Fur family transcriptional regulator, peroxide stress response regulator